MSPSLPRVRHDARSTSKSPEGNRPLFGPRTQAPGAPDADPAGPYLGLAIGGVVLFAVTVLVLVSWTLYRAA